MYYDSDYGGWNDAACEEMAEYDGNYNNDGNDGNNNGRRCARMDCHLQGSDHFRLLGFFKEPNFAQFYEQLFKHQGICVWDDDTYEFMQTMRELWPQGCTNTGVTDNHGNYLYFDVKPLSNADINVGLYTDARCSVDYTGNEDISDILSMYQGYRNENNQGGDLELADLVYYIDYWNQAMQMYKQCQPCKAYNLYAEYEEVNQCQEVEKNDDYYKTMYGHYWYYYEHYGEPDDDYYQALYNNIYGECEDYEDDYSNDDSQGHFTCEDDAGYK